MKEALKKVLKYVDIKGLLIDWLVKEELDKALDKIVNDSSNPYDNMLKATVMPVVVKELEGALDKKLAEITA